jgi:hypothetical protein
MFQLRSYRFGPTVDKFVESDLDFLAGVVVGDVQPH